MANSAELDEALDLVLRMCTAEQIKAVLRMRKDDDAVRVTAENKKLLVERNLRDAVLAGSVKLGTVFDLIRESEENGSQHIWYYKARSDVAQLMQADAVAARLWGKNWQNVTSKFPSLLLKHEDYVVSDFRTSPKKPQDWYLKLYGHTVVTHPTGKEKAGDGGRFWREYVNEPLRTVILVRWNNPGLLEIRVDRNDSRKRVEGWQKTAWDFLREALVKEQFRPWELEKATRRMVLECEKHQDLYTFRDAGVLDEQQEVLAQFEAVQVQGNLLQSHNTIEAIKKYVQDGGSLKRLAITWLSEKTALSSDLRVLAGVKESNEVLVSAKCKAGDVDHVTDQFRRFS